MPEEKEGLHYLHESRTLLKIVSVPYNTISEKSGKFCYSFHNVFLRIIFLKDNNLYYTSAGLVST